MTLRTALRRALNRGSSAERERGTHLRAAERVAFALRRGLLRRTRIADGERVYEFECGTEEELYRARTMLEKEPGTIRWLERELRPGDVLYDIGANIGVYTIFAAHRLGSNGSVCAFEPHVPTFQSLLRNIALNGLGDRVIAVSCALHGKNGFLPFNYRELAPGSSDSQFDRAQTAKQRPFKPQATELKYGTRVDTVLRKGVIPPPDLVKLDVDGNELAILRGMKELLTSERAPRGLQVEVNPRSSAVAEFLASCDYELTEHHYTVYQERKIAAGMSPDKAGSNAVFRRRSTTLAGRA